MVYNEKLVSVVKCNGKILREDNGKVFLPFGSEYSILIKNLNSTKALVKISIDGKCMTPIIIKENTQAEIEGFIEGNRINNKFKFIEKTKEISDYRGDRIDDGIIRIEHQFEIPYNTYYTLTSSLRDSYKVVDSSAVLYGSNPRNVILGSSNNVFSSSVNSDGITVKGNDVNINLSQGHIGNLSDSKVTIIKLEGYNKNTKECIKQPIEVKTKLICSSCGKKNKSYFSFCPRCGTRIL